jgi:hypothetical protein
MAKSLKFDTSFNFGANAARPKKTAPKSRKRSGKKGNGKGNGKGKNGGS